MITPADLVVTRREDDVFVHLCVSVNRSVEKFAILNEGPEVVKKATEELCTLLWRYIYGDIESDLTALCDRIGRERIARAEVLAGLQAVLTKLRLP